MSIRSRCSSAPPSERDGGDEMKKIDLINVYNDDEEHIIDWDEPDKPDKGNSSRKKTIYIYIYLYILLFRMHSCRLHDC
jgi:hypothetical protein